MKKCLNPFPYSKEGHRVLFDVLNKFLNIQRVLEQFKPDEPKIGVTWALGQFTEAELKAMFIQSSALCYYKFLPIFANAKVAANFGIAFGRHIPYINVRAEAILRKLFNQELFFDLLQTEVPGIADIAKLCRSAMEQLVTITFIEPVTRYFGYGHLVASKSVRKFDCNMGNFVDMENEEVKLVLLIAKGYENSFENLRFPSLEKIASVKATAFGEFQKYKYGNTRMLFILAETETLGYDIIENENICMHSTYKIIIDDIACSNCENLH